ncbi:MAG TPA: magnesium chelatase [Cytophagales bacterium]|nr:magnesium chelatase [Cytophagales bacterium]HAA24181.1 magnesium chelatase [Cytophagales bacterium]HAP60970.1 magnesium chelatase [Cytophagales bacterium]
MDIQEAQESLGGLNEALSQIRQEVGKILVGQTQMVDLLLTALLADGHVLLEGVPGVAKTLTAKLVARTLSVDFSRIQFTPDLMPSDVLGTSIFNMKSSEFEYKQGPIFSNFVLIDEINRAPAKTQSALFEVMEERQVTVDGHTYSMAPPFIVIATQNPIEQEGTYRLPEAQLDRFMFKVEVNYPSLDSEVDILRGFHQRNDSAKPEDINSVLTAEDLAKFRQQIHSVHVEDSLIRYMATLVQRTREDQSLYLGASPRASLAILASSKAFAALQGRTFVTPEDAKFVALPVLRHRIMLTPEREMEGATTDEVLKELIDNVEVPR